MKPYETYEILWNHMKFYETTICWCFKRQLCFNIFQIFGLTPPGIAQFTTHAAHGDAFRNAPQRGKELVVLHGREGRQQHDDHPTGGQQIGVAQLQGVQSTADLLGAVNSELAVGEGAVGWFLMGSRDNHKKESEGNFIDDFPRETVIFHRI